ncbi:hypothetical protein TNCV_658391 [Trichonephila clavipes]|uniref:Uncharacterized protein n=1 Tax=Trichonephila clavipes TaxID=2585209 RepID=A0A8X6SPW5_TRICX|nr:hypothetical protein TNCV_658391 [Trichonephila clavipes]
MLCRWAWVRIPEKVCKCIVPSRQGGTLNSRRVSSLLVRLVEREEKWKASDHPRANRTVICMVLKAKDNDRRKM